MPDGRDATGYASPTAETLAGRLGEVPALRERPGDPGTRAERERGDDNLNLDFILEGQGGALVVKQALPHLRLVGEGWPLPLRRSFFEYLALTRKDARDPGSVPEVVHFGEAQALIAME